MTDGPEQLYAKLTSGRPGELEAAIETCRTTLRHLDDAIDLISIANDKPQWDSTEAHEAYNIRAWATRAATEVSFIRVNRASLAVQMASAAYVTTSQAAADVIEWWRSNKRADLSGDLLILVRLIASARLLALTSQLESKLTEAISFVEADPLSGDQEQWRTNGLLKTMLHDLGSPTDTGPIIPNTLATGDDDTGWKPQGLGYDPNGQSPALLQTAYSGSQAQLSRIDPDTGEQLGFVNLDGYDGRGPDHAGGVVVHGDTVYVMSSSTDVESPDGPKPGIFSYSLQEVRDAAPGQTISAQTDPTEMAAAAYSTIDGDTLYVGTHEKDGPGELFTYTKDDSGTWALRSGPHPTPPQTQGAAVVDGQVVFSTSFGRGNTSELQAYRLGDVLSGHGSDESRALGTIDLPTMSEGVLSMDGKGLLTTYESGAGPYSTPEGSTGLAELWAAQAMTLTPFSAVGMVGGISVLPVTLQQASVDFESSGRRLQRAASSIDEVSLTSGCLGKVTQGDAFARVVTKHCDTTADWIGEGRISAGVTADGLVTSAEAYVATDEAISGWFAAFTSGMGGS